MAQAKEAWSSRFGVILAVAGSAVGLGNFLRFPGLAAQYGGGAFMIAYFVSLLLIGIPLGWVEWTLGREGGRRGFHSTAGIFHALMDRPWAKYLGVIGFFTPVVIYTYYVYVEAWCLGYALNAITGKLSVAGMNYGEFFARFTGAQADGVALQFGLHDVGIFVLIVYVLNFFFIYRGISKGIETVCTYAMPALILIAVIILARVLTLGTPDASKPDQSVLNGLGYLWNPRDVATGLKNPELWLAAAGQIFFSLSVGFGVIITYASYLKTKDDVVLSGLTASAANEFCEVGLGGLITVPAAFIFLGAAGVAGQGTFALGFNVLPEVFVRMPGGQIFASIFFILLFLAAITSSLSMLQPGIAFLEEGLGLGRKASVALLGLCHRHRHALCLVLFPRSQGDGYARFLGRHAHALHPGHHPGDHFCLECRHRARLEAHARGGGDACAHDLQVHSPVGHSSLPGGHLRPVADEECCGLEFFVHPAGLRAQRLRARPDR
jgi:NSS family neurotransmitter:Na+ symporter